LETTLSALSFGKSFMKIRSAVPENGYLVFFVTDGKNKKKREKNICKTYTHPPHRRLRKPVPARQPTRLLYGPSPVRHCDDVTYSITVQPRAKPRLKNWGSPSFLPVPTNVQLQRSKASRGEKWGVPSSAD